jgi:prepilin-type N-terminal cleavage/methylation domain-containing protein/prepilin-type processing-associated H-X9-DG protein
MDSGMTTLSTRRAGFTITEMLVVMLVLALLVSLAIPVFSRQAARARQAKCLSNLRHIGEAALVYKAAEDNERLAPLDADGWATTLLPYLGDNPRALLCPEDEEYSSTGLPNIRVRIRSGGSPLYDADLFHVYPFWREGSHADFGYKPAVWVMNNEEYMQFGIDHDAPFGNSGFTYNPALNQLPRYTPGVDRNLYWVLMEDQRGEQGGNIAIGDGSLNDLHVRVQKLEGNQYDCEFYKDPASLYVCDLLLPPDVWVNEADATQVDDDGNLPGIGRGNTHGPYLFHGLGELSYGMNSLSRYLTGGSHRILAIDYEDEVVDIGGYTGASQGYDILQAPRHFGQANVLWADGSVTSMDCDAIDPEIPDIGEQYWLPGIAPD